MAQVAPLLLTVSLLFAYGLVLALAACAVLSPAPGYRILRILVVPAGASLVLLALLIAIFPGQSVSLAQRLVGGGFAIVELHLSMFASWGLLAAAWLAAAMTAYVFAHAIPFAIARFRARRGEPSFRVADVVRLTLLGALAVSVVGAALFTSGVAADTSHASAEAQILFEFPLPGSPTGMAIDGDGSSGFITLGEGKILHFTLSADHSNALFDEVADGLTFPRGPAIVAQSLLLSNLTSVGCPEAFPQCWTADPQEEFNRLKTSSASVLAFPIQGDHLGSPTHVFDGLPVVNTEHAPNSLTLGPDGYVYMPIGNVDRMPLQPNLIPLVNRPNADLLGTIVRFRPGDERPQIFASGIRNIYSLAFAPDGSLFGSDNDGQAVRGWRHEQLVQIQDGADFGFPQAGTFGTGVPAPLWTWSEAGGAGIAWAESGSTAGLLVGAFGDVLFVPLAHDEDGYYVRNEQDVRKVATGLGGFVTSIHRLGDDYVLTLFDPTEAHNSLIVFRLAPAGGQG